MLGLDLINQVDKKVRFIIQAFAVGGGLTFLFARGDVPVITSFVILFIIVLIGSFFTNYPNISWQGIAVSLILPVHLVAGSILFLRHFPNLGDLFRIALIFSFTFLYYIVLAVDNIFLVVHDRGEIIPLYRAAVTWSLILVVINVIPLYSGLFKLPYSPFLISLLIVGSTFVLSIYQLWISKYDEDNKDIKIGETVLLSLLPSFLISVAVLATMFFPSEAFLRAIFVSSVLMFALNYVNSYLKNNTSKSMLIEYFIIMFLFLTLLLLFTN